MVVSEVGYVIVLAVDEPSPTEERYRNELYEIVGIRKTTESF